jgi:chromosome segregation ATPase
MNWLRSLEEKIEVLRKKMEETAMQLGISHPKVYQLSRELDHLHNQWEREHANRKKAKGNIYSLRPQVPEKADLNMVKAI